MELQEFVFLKEKNKEINKSLKVLNEKRKSIKGKDYCDEGIKPDCKCGWGGSCECICRYNHK